MIRVVTLHTEQYAYAQNNALYPLFFGSYAYCIVPATFMIDRLFFITQTRLEWWMIIFFVVVIVDSTVVIFGYKIYPETIRKTPITIRSTKTVKT